MAGKYSALEKFAWFSLAYNVLVILWGVFLRASHSGDGCGQYWLTCGGELIPTAPAFKTVIEFSHRISTAVAGLLVLVLVIWVYRANEKGNLVRKTAFLSLVFIIIEGLIGRGLVLTGNTAGNWTPTRPFWTAGHLINTFILLAFLALTAKFSASPFSKRFSASAKEWVFLAVGLAAILFVSMSGSMAALTNMLFPSSTIAEGIVKDFSEGSHYLLRLRISHPIMSIIAGVYLIFLSGWLRSWSNGDNSVTWWSRILAGLVVVQLVFGAATLLLLAPMIMQLGHVFLADAIWITYVLLTVSFLSRQAGKVEAPDPTLI